MTPTREPLAEHLAQPSQLGTEISITGKWVPNDPGRRFRTSEDAKELVREWEDIHQSARETPGVLSTEINHAVGEDAVLIHHVFESPESVNEYFTSTATEHLAALRAVATPELHLVRGIDIPTEIKALVASTGVNVAFGRHLFGFVRDADKPDHETAINVTAKWTTKPDGDHLDELEYWWQMVGTEAYEIEKGMVRFETYRVEGEDALIIHEVFDSTDELKFHLTKGTAEKYKKDIDQIAAPEAYYFRGPVSWTIRTYSKFMHLPATYTSQGSNFTRSGGSASDGIVA